MAADPRPSVEEAPTMAADSEQAVGVAPTIAESDTRRSVGNAATVDSGSDGKRGAATPMPSVARGDTFDQFVVLDEIGRGGMGVVVAAHDPDLDRKVAIKILRPEAGGTQNAENASERLRREAQAMAKLAHPNVITVHQVGTRGAEIYVVMEFVAGGTLRDWVQKKQRTWREVLDTYLSAGRGLAAAHKAGLVHRDFKPDNILIDEEGRVRVTDFGLVGRIGESEADPEDTLKDFPSHASPSDIRKALTRPGQVMGTPYYMAPEQHKGTTTDARADQFAFCVSLYEALYDQRPFAGESYEEVAFNAIFEPAAAPPADSAVPARILEILSRGMSKRPDDRYADMEALLAELAVDPMAARRRVLTVAAAATLLLAGAGTLYALWPEKEDASARCAKAARSVDKVWNADRRAELEAAFASSDLPGAGAASRNTAAALDEYTASIASMRKQACEATLVRGEQSDELFDKRMFCLDKLQSELSGFVGRLERDADSRILGSASQAVANLPQAARCGDIEALAEAIPPPTDPDERARMAELIEQLGTANTHLVFGEYEEGLALARQVAEAAESLEYVPLVADSNRILGRLLYRTGDYSGSEAALRASIKAAADAKEYYVEAEAWLSLVFVVGHMQGRADEGLGLAQAAQAALARVEPESVLHANMLNVEGLVLLSQGKHDEAAKRLVLAVEAFVKAHGPEHLDVAVARNNLGNALQNLGRYDEARKQLEQVVTIRTKYLGNSHPDMATALNDLGLVAHEEGKLDEAQQHLERAVAIRLAALGDSHRRTADALNNLALNEVEQGRVAEGVETYRRSLSILEKVFGENSVEVTGVLANLGDALLALGQQRPAWESYARALANVEYVRGPEHIQVTEHVEKLAFMLRKMGGYDQSLQYYARSLAIREKTLGPMHFNVAMTLNNRGALFMDAERYDDARADFERARYIYAHYYGEAHPDVAMVDFNLAVGYEQQRDYARAVELYERALASLEARYGEESPKVVNAIRGLGDVAHAQGHYGKASEHFARILAIVTKAHGADSPALADPYTWQGTNYLVARRWQEAEVALRHAFELRKKGGEDSALVGVNQFLLAQATWGRGGRAEATRLAREARKLFVAAGERAVGNVKEVDAWLRKHR